MTKSSFPRRLSSGFTLIELLTVIAIIGILAAILIPVVGQVREQARETLCRSNLRQIAAGYHLYALDNDGKTPDLGPGRDSTPVFGTLLANYPLGLLVGEPLGWGSSDYLGGWDVLFCPSQKLYPMPEDDFAQRPLRAGYIWGHLPPKSSPTSPAINAWGRGGWTNHKIDDNPNMPIAFDFGHANFGNLLPPSHPNVINVAHLGGQVTSHQIHEANQVMTDYISLMRFFGRNPTR